MTKAIIPGTEVLARVIICNNGNEGGVEISGRDGGGFAYVEASDIVSEESIKRTTPEAVWVPSNIITAPLFAKIEAAANNQGGHVYGVKNGGENYLWFVLCKVDKSSADLPDQFEWVTWLCNTSDKDAFLCEGHYHTIRNFKSEGHAYASALDDFNRRR